MVGVWRVGESRIAIHYSRFARGREPENCAGGARDGVLVESTAMKLKVCTCWDDGVLNDERLACLFRKHGAKATFNLNPGLMSETRGVREWAAPRSPGWSHLGFRCGKLSLRDIPEVYAGFQLASHCWCHENAGSMPDDEWIASAMRARTYLEDVVQRPCTGFAWPCGVFTPGTIAKLREAGFEYGRTTRYAEDVLAENPEPMALKSSCHFLSGDFWRRYDEAKARGGVFYFWGHSYEIFEYDPLWDQLEGKLRFIAEDPDAEWIDVVDLARALPAAR